MKWFEVMLIKRTSTTVELAANSAEEAQYEAIYRLMRGKIELDGGRDFDDIETTAVEIETPSSIPIYWEDLTPQKQAEIFAAFGGNCNYDAFPIAEIPLTEETEEEP